MSLYPGPSDLGRSFSEGLSDVEINIQILKVLDHEENLNLVASPPPSPLRKWVVGTGVSLFVCLDLFSHLARFHLLIALMTLRRVSGVP
jgi:hypothetical protein